MANVTLHRRHGPACPGGHPQHSFTYEPEEQRKSWKRCDCRIYAHGTLAGVFHRLATKQRDWERAREVLAPYLAAGRWDLEPPILPPPPPAPPSGPGAPAPPRETPGTPVADAVKAFLKEHEDTGSAGNTIKKYRAVLAKFARFSAHLGLRYLQEWRPSHVRQFRTSLGVSHRTALKNLGVIKGFFELFVEDEVLASNPARIKTRRNRAVTKGAADAPQKNPYTDEELRRMLDGCARVGRTNIREWPKKRDGKQVVAITEYRDYRRKWTGEDLADFIQISVFTGLRISDVATFHIDRLTPAGEVKVRATKNGNWVCVWIPEWLRDRIRARALRIGPLIFGEHATTDINVITDVWRRKLNLLWEENGPWKHKPVHHRFRHTFVRILLERNAPMQLIADLTGDTEQMIRLHYSAWAPERQENASRILEQAFRDVPRYHGR